MRRHAVPGLLLAVAAAPAGAAGPACHLIQGDPADRLPTDVAIEVTTADVASNAREVTAVVRVKDLDGVPAVRGRWYAFYFSTAATESYRLEAVVWPDGATEGFFSAVDAPYFPPYTSPQGYTLLSAARVVVDVARNEVRLTAPMSAIPRYARAKPGATVTYLAATTSHVNGVQRPAGVPGGPPTGVSVGGDHAVGGSRATYRLGARSCVAVGR